MKGFFQQHCPRAGWVFWAGPCSVCWVAKMLGVVWAQNMWIKL